MCLKTTKKKNQFSHNHIETQIWFEEIVAEYFSINQQCQLVIVRERIFANAVLHCHISKAIYPPQKTMHKEVVLNRIDQILKSIKTCKIISTIKTLYSIVDFCKS